MMLPAAVVRTWTISPTGLDRTTMPSNDLPSPSGTFRVSDLIAVAAVASVLAAWTSVAAGHFSPAAWLGCQAICFVFYGAGTIVSSWSSLGTGIRFDLPLRL